MKFAIDFNLVDKLFRKIAKSYEDSEKMKQAIERLLELFETEFLS